GKLWPAAARADFCADGKGIPPGNVICANLLLGVVLVLSRPSHKIEPPIVTNSRTVTGRARRRPRLAFQVGLTDDRWELCAPIPLTNSLRRSAMNGTWSCFTVLPPI